MDGICILQNIYVDCMYDHIRYIYYDMAYYIKSHESQ